MSKEKDYWFKAKRYGWGWGLPLTWQGWVSFGIFIAIWLAALFMLLPTDSDQMPTKNLVSFLVILGLDILGLVVVSFKHGEPPKWHWGNKTTSKRKD